MARGVQVENPLMASHRWAIVYFDSVRFFFHLYEKITSDKRMWWLSLFTLSNSCYRLSFIHWGLLKYRLFVQNAFQLQILWKLVFPKLFLQFRVFRFCTEPCSDGAVLCKKFKSIRLNTRMLWKNVFFGEIWIQDAFRTERVYYDSFGAFIR